LGDTCDEELFMIETTVDYWTCIDLAHALEQTMQNDLWSTAERIAEIAMRITTKPDELVTALKKYEIGLAAMVAASDITDTTVPTLPLRNSNLSKAG